MYAPEPFICHDEQTARSLIDDIVMGTLIVKEPDFQGSPLPFTIAKRTDEFVLLTHLDKRNPLSNILKQSPQVMVVFWGPNSYLSPTHYLSSPRVPTWLYANVHITGQAEVVEKTEFPSQVVTELCEHMEGDNPDWSLTKVSDYKDRIVQYIDAFEIKVSTYVSQLRLGQQNSQQEFTHIVQQLTQQLGNNAPLVATINKYLSHS